MWLALGRLIVSTLCFFFKGVYFISTFFFFFSFYSWCWHAFCCIGSLGLDLAYFRVWSFIFSSQKVLLLILVAFCSYNSFRTIIIFVVPRFSLILSSFWLYFFYSRCFDFLLIEFGFGPVVLLYFKIKKMVLPILVGFCSSNSFRDWFSSMYLLFESSCIGYFWLNKDNCPSINRWILIIIWSQQLDCNEGLIISSMQLVFR